MAPTEKVQLALGEGENAEFEEKQFLTENLEDEFDLTANFDPPKLAHNENNENLPRTRSGRPYSGQTTNKKRIIVPQFSASTLARTNMAQSLFRGRNALPPHTQAHIEKLCEIAATAVVCQAQKIGSPPPSYSSHNFHAYARDEYGLPVSVGGTAEPHWVIKRREFLKRLSVRDRNLLLTGDPYFRFDPVVYQCCFFLPRRALPPILQNNMAHIIPENIVSSDSESEQESESDIDSDPEPENLNETQFQTADESPSSDTNSNINSDTESNTTVNISSHNSSSDNLTIEPCAPPTPPVVDPARTRSGRPYSSLPAAPSAPATSQPGPSMLGGALSRVRRIAGDLMDSHPLATQQKQQRKKK